MYCSYCKATIIETDSFCSHCGKSAGVINKESEFACSECGKDVPVDALFCWNCGASMGGTENTGAVPSQSSQPAEIKLLKFKTLKANKKVVEESFCKICERKFTIGEDVNQCENCHSFYHVSCWNNAGGCNQPTCKEETKRCPFCGEEIKKSAIKCRFCGNFLDASLRDRQIPKGKLKDATTALTLAIIGIFCFGIILGPIAIAKGNKARRIIDSEPGWEGRGSATAAIIIGWIDIAFFVIWILIQVASLQ